MSRMVGGANETLPAPTIVIFRFAGFFMFGSRFRYQPDVDDIARESVLDGEIDVLLRQGDSLMPDQAASHVRASLALIGPEVNVIFILV
jgi:hypothetical protein